ncbi:MAG TPA: cytochrome P450 [Gaiellaceae bacterium]
MPEPDFDPLDPAFVADPHPTWARLRRERAVARGARWGFWALTRYEDVKAVSADYGTFTSELGIVVPSNPVSGRRAPLHFDPPEHPRYRRPLNAALSAERVRALEPTIRALVVELLEPLLARGGGELVRELTSPLTALVFAEFVRLPRERALELNGHSEAFERAQQERDTGAAERENLLLYEACRQLVRERRAAPLDPDDDIVSALLALERDDEFVAGSVRQLLIAAHVAPTAAIASAVRHLAEDAALQARLRAEPGLLPAAVDELLRLYTPNQGFARTARADAEIRGCPVRAGEQVALVLTSANRDEDVFAEPDAFRLDREAPHLAFGHGPHKCPGAHAARAELRIVLEELLARTERVELAGEVEMVPWPLYGPAALPVALVPAGFS